MAYSYNGKVTVHQSFDIDYMTIPEAIVELKRVLDTVPENLRNKAKIDIDYMDDYLDCHVHYTREATEEEKREEAARLDTQRANREQQLRDLAASLGKKVVDK